MPIPRSRLSMRARLTLWYTLAIAVSLTVFGGAVFSAMKATLEADLNEQLLQATTVLAERLDYEFRDDEEIAYAAEALVRKSPFRTASIAVLGPDGRVLAATSDLEDETVISSIDRDAIPRLGEGIYRVRRSSVPTDPAGVEVAAIRVDYLETGIPYFVVCATSRTPVVSAMTTLLGLMWVLLPLLLVLASLLGAYLVHRALVPVLTMSEQAAQMGADNLGERLAVANPDDELGRLARVFNGLLDRIEASFDRMRQFVADASHELRTPVTVIRSEADVASTPPVSLEEALESLVVVREEARRLGRLVDDMFLLARADAGVPPLHLTERVSIRRVVATCIRSAEALAANASVAVRWDDRLEDDPVCIGDAARLEQMLLNLLDNAIKYAGESSVVEVVSAIEGDMPHRFAVVTVSDTGPGVPDTHREAIFERFVRVDTSRTRRAGGSGLGLPIARWIAEAHGGDLVLERSDGSGSTFAVRLPVPRESGESDAPHPTKDDRTARA